FRQEQIDGLTRRSTIAEPELGTIGLEHLGPVEFGFTGPAGEDLRILRHAGAIVVFSFVVDGGHHWPPRAARRICGMSGAQASWGGRGLVAKERRACGKPKTVFLVNPAR